MTSARSRSKVVSPLWYDGELGEQPKVVMKTLASHQRQQIFLNRDCAYINDFHLNPPPPHTHTRANLTIKIFLLSLFVPSINPCIPGTPGISFTTAAACTVHFLAGLQHHNTLNT